MCTIKSWIYLVVFVLELVCTCNGSNEFEGEYPECLAPFSDPNPQKRLIIDTDAGADDGVAILNILGAEELFSNIQVQFITAVFGNTHVDNVAINVLKILQTVDRLDIPLYKGANQSILWTPTIDNFYGEDGFGDFPFEDPPSENFLRNKHAVSALIEATMSFPGELTLVCLGPLTNIALAIKLESKFLKNLKEIYILGGSDSGVGNVRPGVEFNFHVDPEAALIVFEEARKIKKVLHLIPWETASVRNPIELKWRKEILGKIQTPQVNLINNAERLTLKGDNWISADTILSSVVIDNSIIESADMYHADVEVCGRTSRAALFVDYSYSTNQTKNIHVIKKINVDKFKKMLLQNFSPKIGQNNGASKI